MTLKEWRGDLTQAEAAELLGVGERTYRRWETGETRTPRSVLFLIHIIYRPDGLQGIMP